MNNYRVIKSFRISSFVVLLVSMLISLLLPINAALANGDFLGVNAALGIGSQSVNVKSGKAEAAPQVQTTEPRHLPPRNQIAVPQVADYAENMKSDVFGANLFTGAFAREAATQFNPDYVVSVGDQIQVRFWGAFQYDSLVTVDPKGNLFLPNIGPVKLLGVRSKDIQRVVSDAVRQAYQTNVLSYANLAAAQPVRVFVGGYVKRPGLYNGTSMDSLLHYLDQAGGIDPNRGTFLNIQVKRGEKMRAKISLYDFLLKGTIPLVQLADGDVIFVPARAHTVKVRGLAENPKQFEFSGRKIKLARLAKLAKPQAKATHVRVVRNTGMVRNIEYYPLADANRILLENGDEVEFVADKKPGTITVRVEGEHQSAQEYVLPYGTRMGQLIRRIKFSERSDTASLQLFRLSVRERQKRMLQSTLNGLENAVLTARSGTSDEARLRKEEASLILQWVDRAKRIEPLGQVIITQAVERDNLLLENGDVIRVPTRDGLILVSGEVLFPTAIAYTEKFTVDDYIRAAGGYSQNADAARVVVAHRDGTFEEVSRGDDFFGMESRKHSLRSGDEILVLPKIDVKSRQIFKDMSQILYQSAISAKVVLGL